jgi:outer membrane protein TolC
VSAKSQSAGAYLTWTLFDGLNMFATAKYLRLQQEQAGNISKENIQSMVANIMDSYYSVVQQKQLLRLSDSSVKFYDVALTTAKNLQLNGKGTRQQVLQAQIDRNAGQAQRLLIANSLEVEKTNLNQLLQRNPDAGFDVIDSIPLIPNFTVDTTEIFLRDHNPSLMYANKQVDVQTAILQQNRSLYYPQLDFNAGYAYNNSSSSASFFLKNQNDGWNAGFTLSWNIFNGMQTRELVQVSKINMDNARWQYRQVLSETKASITAQLKNYKTALDEMVLLRENLNLAYENLQLATEQYKLFAITQIDLQRAHKSFDDAGSNYIASVYAVKKVETNLLLLSGSLVQ